MNYESTDRLWYGAYFYIHKMMAVRGFLPTTPQKEFEDFRLLRSSWQHNEPVISFVNINKPGYVHYAYFIIDLNAQATGSLTAFMDDKSRNGVNIQVSAITDNLTKTAGKVKEFLSTNAVPYATRLALSDAGATERILRIFLVSDLQYNPLEHNLQPKITHITDEAQKDALRLKLIRAAVEKDKTLFELLPLQYLNDVVSVWYDARVGDIFYYERTIGGISPYYRIVIPTADKVKEKKSK